MRQLAALSVVLILGGWLAAGAEGPDDQFIHIHSLIQQADALRESGQGRAAQERYLEAQAALLKLETDYPRWNDVIINYRKSYLARRLAALGALVPPTAPAAPTKPTETAPPKAVADERESQINSLNEEINSLKAERESLEAKLREALSAQPAGVDPRELAKAEERIKGLQQELTQLKGSAAQPQDIPAKVAAPTTLAEARSALKEANTALAKQAKTVSQLTKDKQDLELRLKKLTDKTEAKARREEAKRPTPAPAAPVAPETTAKTTDLAGKLQQAEKELAQQRSRAETLAAEKAALEKQVAALSAQPSPAAPGKEKTAAESRAARTAKAVEKVQLRQMEKERDELRKRVAVLTRQLQERQARKGGAQAEQIAEQLAILRARVEVYEARAVPYSPEELALFKESVALSAKPDAPALKKAAKQAPAGAAVLMAEARRAFDARRFDEAEKKLQEVLKMDEKNVGTLTDLAAAQLQLNRLDEAEANLKLALAGDPYDGAGLSLLGLLRFKQAKYDEALETLTKASQLDTDNAITYNYLGIVLSQKGQRQPAETALRKAVQLQPSYAEAHHNLAVIYATQKPPYLELARYHYQKALAAGHPHNAELEKLLEAK